MHQKQVPLPVHHQGGTLTLRASRDSRQGTEADLLVESLPRSATSLLPLLIHQQPSRLKQALQIPASGGALAMPFHQV